MSLENVLLDVKELGRGMELLRRECGLHEHSVLRAFLASSEGKLERLQRDARTAEVRPPVPLQHPSCTPRAHPSCASAVPVPLQDAYNTVVRYFGESPKTTPPSVFFPVFVRFIRSYKVRLGREVTLGGGAEGRGCLHHPPSLRQDAEQENETRKKQEEVMREKLLAQEAKKQEKVRAGGTRGHTKGNPHPGHPKPVPLHSATSGSSRS